MKKTIIFLMSALFAVAAWNASAADSTSNEAKNKAAHETKLKSASPDLKGEQAVLDKLTKKFPNTRITMINKAPMKGLYEVVMGKNIAYVDEDANYFLFGHIFDMTTQQDITQARIDDLNQIDFNNLPLDKAIKIVKGDGSRVFAVFSDPDCPYCKRLEADLSELNNYTMYVFLFPIAELHPEASAHAKAIWCSADKPSAWHEFLLKDTLPVVDAAKLQECKTPIGDIEKLGHELGVNGTPTLITKAGKVMPGAPQGKEALDQFLTAVGTKRPNMGAGIPVTTDK